MKWLTFWKSNKDKTDLISVAEKQLSENVKVIESLRDYDQGKKDISTSRVRRNLSNI